MERRKRTEEMFTQMKDRMSKMRMGGPDFEVSDLLFYFNTIKGHSRPMSPYVGVLQLSACKSRIGLELWGM